MRIEDLLTPESCDAYNKRCVDAAVQGEAMMADFWRDRDELLSKSPALSRWIKALEDADLGTGACANIWKSLLDDGFLIPPACGAIRQASGVFDFKLISPLIFDISRETNESTQLDFAFNSIHVCFRRGAVADGLQVPRDWSNPAIVDAELFEIPPSVSADNLDDREKIHVTYIVGKFEGRIVWKPLYIGIGTGEPYGRGPRRRATRGRFRFYRYDAIGNHHFEMIRVDRGREWCLENVETVHDRTIVGDSRATLQLARDSREAGWLVVSDPLVMRPFAEFLRHNPENQVVFQDVVLDKLHLDLPADLSNLPFAPDDLAAALEHAWANHRLFFVAWQHPKRLASADLVNRYYDELPSFRRAELDLCRVRPQLVGWADSASPPRICDVLRNCELREQIDRTQGAVPAIEEWLVPEIIECLYAFGNHPELRLCSAIALWKRLWDSGFWTDAIEGTYRERLYELDISGARVCSSA